MTATWPSRPRTQQTTRQAAQRTAQTRPAPEPGGFEFDERPHGRHVPVAQADAQELPWRRYRPDGGITRLIEATCGCKARVYELWVAGGVRYIARIDTGNTPDAYTWGGDTVDTNRLWDALMSGQAR